jgi:hypothetical protein
MRRRTLPPLLLGVLLVAALVAQSGCGGSGSGSSTSLSQAAASAGRPVTGPLIGVTFDGPVLSPQVNLSQEADRAVASGAESMRLAVDWALVQPVASMAQIPSTQRSSFVSVGGVPTTFTTLDRVIGAAAAKRLSVLPVIEYTPSWDATHPGNPASPPAHTAPYAAFLTALIKRYGPSGSFWSSHPQLPKIPIHMWQIWNEPHFTTYWTTQPFAPSYVALLRAAHDAIKAADPSAKVVLAGLADFSWQYLAQIYRQPGASNLFDIVAIHPYTAKPQGVITILKRSREVMNQHGDSAKPILATEITWPSSQGKSPPQFGVGVSEDQQARLLGQVMPLLDAEAAQLHLMGFYWYTWMGNETPSKHPYGFDFAGLEKYVSGAISVKPALASFRRQALRIEGCASKPTATTCG